MEDILDQGTAASNSNQNTPKVPLPNAGGILAMGIMSIVFAGGIGIILGIIALSMSGAALNKYRENPDKYTHSSYKNANAGKICSIIGISLAAFVIIIVILVNV